MIKSMTGFGKAEVTAGGSKITVEIKSLNGKQLDISQVKIPHVYKEKELDIRTSIAQALLRGKVDVFITIEQEQEATAPQLNRSVFNSYLNQIQDVSKEFGLPLGGEPILQTILRLPEVFKQVAVDVSPAEWAALEVCVGKALESIIRFREQEGEALRQDLLARVRSILDALQQIAPLEQERMGVVRKRIMDSLGGLLEDVKFDRNRFEQELLYYMEKLDINEEKVRLNNHCHYFIETLAQEEPVGRKLAFVAQEMGREINTLGSKANHVGIQRLVVGMKDELERLKEQLLNVL